MFPIPPGTHWSEVKAVAVPVERGLAVPAEQKQIASRKRSGQRPKPPQRPAGLLSGFRFASDEKLREQEAPKAAKAKPPKAPQAKIDPKFFTAARELRDRWMEQVNGDALALPSQGKYEVTRMLEAPSMKVNPTLPNQLPEAA